MRLPKFPAPVAICRKSPLGMTAAEQSGCHHNFDLVVSVGLQVEPIMIAYKKSVLGLDSCSGVHRNLTFGTLASGVA
jgi:hypothetical protein